MEAKGGKGGLEVGESGFNVGLDKQFVPFWNGLMHLIGTVKNDVITMRMDDECPICVEPFNTRRRRPVECKHCRVRACHECVSTYLLGREEPECMSCHAPWDHDFLCLSMTKSFMRNAYKEHIKELLVAEVERGLGDYQEVAALMNEKEAIRGRLNEVDARLSEIEAQMGRLVGVEVVLGERRFELWMDLGGVDETLWGSFIVRHVQGLVSPPPTAEDVAAEEEVVRGLERERQHTRIMHVLAVLDMNVFYTDKLLIALAAEMRVVPCTAEERKASLEAAREAKDQYTVLHARKKELYEECMRREDAPLEPLIALADECRQVSRRFWKHLFRAKPPTREDFARLDEDKELYSSNIKHYKQRMRQSTLDLESVRGTINSNTRYYYNLDDHLLYPVAESGANDAEAASALAAEEEKWRIRRQEADEEASTLTPVYNELQEALAKVAREVRAKNRKRDKKGHHTTNCPRGECPGKLVEHVCGVCGHASCEECLAEKGDGHVCRKEDKETARELRRNTRPCPKCDARIYKVEGCDQMWCVRCHTAFSWKTGALVHGVVHNPHFYDYRRRTGSAPRAPGDVPCGGMPNEIEMLNATQRTGNALMFDMWEYCLWLSETKMPSVYRRFHNTRPIRERRYSIAYLRGKVDRKRLKTLLHTSHMDEIRYADYYAILETLIDNVAEHMRRYVAGEDTEVECRSLLRIADRDVGALNERHGIRLEGIRWFF